ncbi:hypothetical protein F5Y16DRAFT_402845 [Xylariaceae sp. FL0255]|nr:hypothetical protein F5Y16DRAFT_402845 [Xylariaceae sp. FL0255]
MLKHLYILGATSASVLLLWLSYTGPPPPIARQPDLPEFPLKPTFLLGDITYRKFNDHAEALWDALIPAHNGAVLGTHIASGFHVWAIPAMFHQLQCLRDIRKELVALNQSAAEARRFMSYRGPDSSYDHITYCFNYLRQSLLCHADTTLHPISQLTPDQQLIDGNALWHMCGDSSVLYKWAETSGEPHKDHLIRERPIVVGKYD